MTDGFWGERLAEQLTWHWDNQLRSRLEGLTDDEYFWEPRPGWNLRLRGQRAVADDEGYIQAGSGDYVIDFASPEPVPAPFTTIAWRIGHLLVGVLGARVAGHFGGQPHDYFAYDYPGTADEALARLDRLKAEWVQGVEGWSDADLRTPVGDLEPGFEDASRATLVLHINREIIHHGAEIALLRDLWANRPHA